MSILAERPARGTGVRDAATASRTPAVTDPQTVEPDPQATAPDPAELPVRADGVELLGAAANSGYRQAPGLVRRHDGQTIQLTPLLYQVLSAVDGHRDHDGIAAEVSRCYGRLVSADNVRSLLAKLRPLGVLCGAGGAQPTVRRVEPLLGLRWRVVVSNPAVTRRITRPFAQLFRPVVLVPVVVAFLATAVWLLFEKGLAAATRQAFDSPGLLLLVFAITVLSAGFHEFGHAAACRYGGGTPGAMGAGLYLVWPAFYTDVNDSYRLGRAGRVRVDMGGLYFNAIVAVAMMGVWLAVRWDALLLIILTQVLQMLRQLAPFLRFDGYHILADLTGVPDLYSRIRPTLLGLLPHRWRHPESTVLRPWARVVVTLWVLVIVPSLLATTVLMALSLPRVAATAVQSLDRQFGAARADWSHADWAMVGVRALSIVAIALPVLGAVLMLVRLVRRSVARTWRATAGRPGRRAVAVVAGIAIVVSLAWAWWPHGDRYRPIGRNERGTVGDAVAVGHQVRDGADTGLRPGTVVNTQGVLPDQAAANLPTREKPQLSVVLVPKGGAAGAAKSPLSDGSPGNGRPAWVFPFNPPGELGPGDNRAMAVNTRDGSTNYDVAFALVWADDGADVTNHNEAWALANCAKCTTVAVAFQVILVVGRTDVIVPQNISAAVNYQCQECVTYALASQLVMTLPQELSPEARRQLDAVWREIEKLGHHIKDVPLGQLAARLEAYKEQIRAIVAAEGGVLLPAGSPSPSGTPVVPGPSAGPGLPSAGPSPVGPIPTPTGPGTPTITAPVTTAPVPSDSPVPSTAPVPSDSPVPSTAPVPSDSPAPSTAPVPSDSPAPAPVP